MVDEPVNGCRGRHRVLEDAIPFPEDEVARDEERAPLVTLGHEGEEDLDLVGALLDVPNVVEDQQLEGVEALKRAWERRDPSWPRAAPARGGRSA